VYSFILQFAIENYKNSVDFLNKYYFFKEIVFVILNTGTSLTSLTRLVGQKKTLPAPKSLNCARVQYLGFEYSEKLFFSCLRFFAMFERRQKFNL